MCSKNRQIKHQSALLLWGKLSACKLFPFSFFEQLAQSTENRANNTAEIKGAERELRRTFSCAAKQFFSIPDERIILEKLTTSMSSMSSRHQQI